MEMTFKINGTYVDGLNPSSLRLTVTNVDPLKWSDMQTAYSGTMNLPRSINNDKIFRAMRYPWTFPREFQYKGELKINGFPPPFSNGVFKLKVTSVDSGYQIAIVETARKFKDFPSVLTWFNYYYNWGTYRAVINAPILLEQIYGTFSMPTVISGTTPSIIAPLVATKPENLVGDGSAFGFNRANEGSEGANYPDYFLRIQDPKLANKVRNVSGGSWAISFPAGTYVILYMPNGTLPTDRRVTLTRSGGSSDQVAVFDNPQSLGDNAFKFFYNSGYGTKRLTSGSATFYFSASGLPSYPRPPQNYSTTESTNLTFSIDSYIGDTTSYIVTDIGFQNGYDLIEKLCKAMLWKYRYNYPDAGGGGGLTLYDMIHNDVLVKPSGASEYRIKWTGRLKGGYKISEMDGIGNILRTNVGSREMNFQLGQFFTNTESSGISSDLPVGVFNGKSTVSDDEQPRFCFATGSAPNIFIIDYFYNNSYLFAKLKRYYEIFKPGIQIEADAVISYWDMKAFKPEAAYYFPEIRSWCYIKSISGWNCITGECTLTLYKLTLPE